MPDPDFLIEGNPPRGSVVLFDFDGTLTRRDSLFPFLRSALGLYGLILTLLKALPWLMGHILHLVSNNVAKERLLSFAFRGRNLSSLEEKGENFATAVLPRMLRPDMMARVAGYQKAGCICVLVSASLDLYLSPWAKSVGMDFVLCTSLSVDQTGRITGTLDGENCYGKEKVRRIRNLFDEQLSGTPLVVLAYGDTAGDIPMLKFADQGWWVRSRSIVPFSGAPSRKAL